jgi:hypothetical protein
MILADARSKPPVADGNPNLQKNSPTSESHLPAEVEPSFVVHIQVVCGGLTNVKAPVTVLGRYDGLDVAGLAKPFDRKPDFWLSRSIEMGKRVVEESEHWQMSVPGTIAVSLIEARRAATPSQIGLINLGRILTLRPR